MSLLIRRHRLIESKMPRRLSFGGIAPLSLDPAFCGASAGINAARTSAPPGRSYTRSVPSVTLAMI